MNLFLYQYLKMTVSLVRFRSLTPGVRFGSPSGAIGWGRSTSGDEGPCRLTPDPCVGMKGGDC